MSSLLNCIRNSGPARAHRRAYPSPMLVLAVALGAAFVLPATVRASCAQMRAAVPMEIIRERGPWRCIEVPGFLIFTRLPDKHSQAFAEELGLLTRQFAALGSPPESLRAPTNQIPVVLKLVPGPARPGAEALEVYADELSLMYVVALPDVAPVDPTVAGNTRVISLDPLMGWGPGPTSPAEQLARDAYRRRMNYAQPPPPVWMREGLTKLMSEARVDPGGVTLMRLGKDARSSEGLPEDIFQVEWDGLESWQREALIARSALFLRWALTVDPKRRVAFWRFAQEAASAPVTEEMFAEAFGVSYGELGVDLSDSRLLRSVRLAGVAIQPTAPVEIRIASSDEVERLLATAEGINERVAVHNAAL